MAPHFGLLLGLLLAAPLAQAAEQSTLVRVTAYWREEGQLRAASNGAYLRNGHCAVDPKKIPYGSKIILGGEELIAVDTGPAVVNRKAARRLGRNRAEKEAMVIDRYFETKSQAVAWVKSHPHFMKVQVLPPAGSAISTKRPASYRNPPARTVIATRETLRPPLFRFAPVTLMADSYFQRLLEPSDTTTRDARRRTGGELPSRNSAFLNKFAGPALPPMKRRMTFLHRNERSTAGRTNFSVRAQSPIHRRAIFA
jgi:hypothetical protein